MEDFDFVKRVLNGNKIDRDEEFVKEFLIFENNDSKKRAIKKLKTELKSGAKYQKRVFFLSEYMSGKTIYDFLSLQFKYSKKIYQEEMQRSYNAIHSKELADKHNLIDENDYIKGGRFFGKPIPKQKANIASENSLKWAEETYPIIVEDKWDAEFELAFALLAPVK